MSTASTLRFLGGAGTVTGSKFLIARGDDQTMIDCGLFQGAKRLRLMNWGPLGVAAADVDRVVLSHAHLDHVGYLPSLVRQGFDGPAYATGATAELAAIVLTDSARLQQEEADYANRAGYSKHRPALPLYTEADADRAIRRIRALDFDRPREVGPDTTVALRPAGHILGAAIVTVGVPEATVTFSGDLGRPRHPLLAAPADPPEADVIVMESTYGDETHGDETAEIERLAAAITRTARRGGVVVVPAFAVDRTEVVLLTLSRLADTGAIPRLPVYVDSPMALAVLEVYRRAIRAGDTAVVWEGADPFDQPGGLFELPTPDDSRSLNTLTGPAIIVSASGMVTGGRVLHHLVRRLDDPRNLVVLVGHQAPGTRGHSLATGAEAVKMLGRYIPVRAEILSSHAFSAHADSDELVGWLSRAARPPGIVYLVHGEPDAAEHLQRRIRSELGWMAVIPNLNEIVRLGD